MLWVSDATTGPDGTPLTLDERVTEVVARYGAGSLVADCMLAIKPALVAAAGRVERARARRYRA